MDKLKQYYYIIVILITLVICWGAWPVVSKFTAKEIQPIASAVSTLSGILFGFVMASISLFASAKDNKLIRNTTLTGYLPKLVNRLHVTMGLLLFVCFTFLLVLFIPDSLTFTVDNLSYKYSVVIVMFGIFLGLNSFVQFYMSWRGFKDFSEHM
ncbi:hypothetical protein [Shewanella scandinavica]|uniref:hypothetical protein n=1 Tax=Shewanella scandinavica TaxID=3063538 RepID=UPI00319B8C00